jgi:S-adenosylmethionine decarboxylase
MQSLLADQKVTPFKLMALWGGFNDTVTDNSGPEKRLEFDFVRRTDPSTLKTIFDIQTWTPVLESLQCLDGVANLQAEYGLTITSRDCLVVVNTEKIVFTSCATVLLHTAVEAILKICDANDIEVEWASYSRKNTNSPWARETDQGMAVEYAVLKSAFPAGKPFLIGPLDSDHFFYFVYDAIDRSMETEEDVQVNLLMYGAKCVTPLTAEVAAAAFGVSNPEALNCAVSSKGKEVSAAHIIDGVQFETLRITNGRLGCVASFETNIASEERYRAQLSRLVEMFQPDRFSVMILLDPQSAPSIHPNANPITFSAYNRLNKATTEFECGKTVTKYNFVKV